MSKFSKATSKVFKTLSKSSTINVGFSNIDKWVDLGNYAMNRIMSGKFDSGFLFGRNYVLYGESGSGKSYNAAIACGNAQKEHDAFVLWLDVEKATDDVAGQKWLTRAGVDTSEENFRYISLATLADIKKTISEMCDIYRDAYMDESDDFERPMIIVVDSWSAAMTDTQMEQATTGVLKGDMGQKAKQTGDVIQAVTHLCSHLPIMVIGVGHIMDNQDMYGPKHKTTGGHKMFFMASGCMMLTKKELKHDDVDNQEVAEYYEALKKGMTATLAKKKQIIGHTCAINNLKSRSSRPFQNIEVQVPFNTGLDPYSGLFDLMIFEGAIKVPSAGWYQYGGDDGPKFRAKEFREHAHEIMKWADTINPNGVFKEMSAEDAEEAFIEMETEHLNEEEEYGDE